MKGLKMKIGKALKAAYVLKSETLTTSVRGYYRFTEGYAFENLFNETYLIYRTSRKDESTAGKVKVIYDILCEAGLTENLELQDEKILIKA